MKAIPAPSIIDGVTWEIRDSGDAVTAFVDFKNTVMVVPLDGTESSDLLRAHETAHVKITPRSTALVKKLAKEFPNRTLQAVEDCRVHMALRNAGISTDASVWPDKDFENLKKAFKSEAKSPEMREEMARCLIAKRGTGDYERIAQIADPEIVEEVEGFYSEFFGDKYLPSFDDTIAMARAIHEYYNSGDSSDSDSGEGESEKGFSEKGFSGSGDLEVSRPFKPGDIENATEAPAFDKDYMSVDEIEELTKLLGAGWHGGDGGEPIRDDEFKVFKHPLKVQHKGKSAFGNKKTSTDTGSIPRRLNRYAVDSAVFSRTTKGGFGTVLIDCSGSMGLTPEMIDDIIDVLPNSTIAGYSGYGYGSRSLRNIKGCLHILAKEGKRIAEIPAMPGGNVCDMQALKWLAKQRGPRAWICDGIVTGEYDDPLNAVNLQKLLRVAKSGNITRYRRVADLLKAKKA